MAQCSGREKPEQRTRVVLAGMVWAHEIAGVHPPSLPYALPAPSFRFRALARLAGRSALGGPREIALAVYLAARLADDAHPKRGLAGAARGRRATAARNWLGSLAIPAIVRASLLRLVDATAEPESDLAGALGDVIAVTATHLDRAARSELDRLSKSLRE